MEKHISLTMSLGKGLEAKNREKWEFSLCPLAMSLTKGLEAQSKL
jgi:hypothetical protein